MKNYQVIILIVILTSWKYYYEMPNAFEWLEKEPANTQKELKVIGSWEEGFNVIEFEYPTEIDGTIDWNIQQDIEFAWIERNTFHYKFRNDEVYLTNLTSSEIESLDLGKINKVPIPSVHRIEKNKLFFADYDKNGKAIYWVEDY